MMEYLHLGTGGILAQSEWIYVLGGSSPDRWQNGCSSAIRTHHPKSSHHGHVYGAIRR
jgi:hypothetical protein